MSIVAWAALAMFMGLAILGLGLSLLLNLGGVSDRQARLYNDPGPGYRLMRRGWWPMSAIQDLLMNSSSGWRFIGAWWCAVGLGMWIAAVVILRTPR